MILAFRLWILWTALLGSQVVFAQPQDESSPADLSSTSAKSQPFASDRHYERHVQSLERAIEKKEWSAVCEQLIQLQAVSPEHLVIHQGMLTSVPNVAARMVTSLPNEGFQVYVRLAEPVARENLQGALQDSDLPAVLQVVRLYHHTPAAREALQILLHQWIDQGNWEEASLLIQRHIPPDSRTISRNPELHPAGRIHDLFFSDSVPTEFRKNFPSLLPAWDYVSDLPEAVRESLETTSRELRESGLSPYPSCSLASFPGGVIVCGPSQRTALDLKTGHVLWRRDIPGYLPEWMRDPGDLGDATRRRMFAISMAQQTFAESLASRTGSDGKQLYFVESIAADDPLVKATPEFKEPVPVNQIVSVRADTGTTLWKFPGLPAGQIYFSGPPAIFGDRLYALGQNQQAGTCLLFTLNARTGELLQSLELATALATPNQSFETNGQAAMIGLARGQLLCATSAGQLISIDPVFGEILWGVQLPGKEPFVELVNPPDGQLKSSGFQNWRGWQDVQLFECSDLLLLAAPGFQNLVALNSRTGTLVWKIPREKAVHLVVDATSETVLLLEKRRIRNIDPQNGGTRWDAVIPEPAGRGILMQGSYLFPIHEYDFARLDLQTREIRYSFHADVRTPHPDGVLPHKIVPRHLLCAEGAAFVVSATGVRRLQSPHLAMAHGKSFSGWEKFWNQAERGEADIAVEDWRALLKSVSASEPLFVRELFQAALARASRTAKTPFLRSELRSQVTELVRTPLERAAWRQMQAQDEIRHRNWSAFVRLWLTCSNAEMDVLLPVADEDAQCRLDRWFQATAMQVITSGTATDAEQLAAEMSRALPSMESLTGEEQQRLWKCLGTTDWGTTWALQLPESGSDLPFWVRQQLCWSKLAHEQNPGIAAAAAHRLCHAYILREQWPEADYWGNRLAAFPAELRLPSHLTVSAVIDAEADGMAAVRKAISASSGWRREIPGINIRTGRSKEVRLLPIPVENRFESLFSHLNAEMDFPAHAALRWNGSNWTRPWYQKLPRTTRNLRYDIGLDRLWAFEQFCVLQTGSELFGMAPLGKKNSRNSQMVWPASGKTIDTLGSRDNLMLSFQRVARVLRPGFEVPPGIRLDEFDHHCAAVGPVRRDYLCLQQMGMLVVLETATGQELWRRYDLPEAPFVCGDDQEVVVISPGERTVKRYRVLDGKETGRSTWTFSTGDILQQQERSLLLASDKFSVAPSAFSQKIEPRTGADLKKTDSRTVGLQLFDLGRQAIQWKREWPAASIPFEIDQRLVGMWLPNGRVELIEQATGRTVRTHHLSFSAPPQRIVSSISQQDVLIVFSTLDPANAIPEPLRLQFGHRHPLVKGISCCFHRETGELLWQQTLPECVFRRDQPVDLPVFVTLAMPVPVPLESSADEPSPDVPPPPVEKPASGGSATEKDADSGAEFADPGILLRCYDRRTGKLLQELTGEKSLYAVTGNQSSGKVIVDTLKTRLEIDFSMDVQEPATTQRDLGTSPMNPEK